MANIKSSRNNNLQKTITTYCYNKAHTRYDFDFEEHINRNTYVHTQIKSKRKNKQIWEVFCHVLNTMMADINPSIIHSQKSHNQIITSNSDY